MRIIDGSSDVCSADLFFYMGRLVQEKGVDVLVRAFAKLHQRHPGRPRLLLIGDGSARAQVERLVAELGIGSSVRFVGAQRSAERRVGNEWVSACRTRWSPYDSKQITSKQDKKK